MNDRLKTIVDLEKSQSSAAFLTSSALSLLAFSDGAISLARVVLPDPGRPMINIIFTVILSFCTHELVNKFN